MNRLPKARLIYLAVLACLLVSTAMMLASLLLPLTVADGDGG